MACEPFFCDRCQAQHERCASCVVECPACEWSGGNVREGEPCVKCETPTIVRPCRKWPLKHLDTCQKHGANNARSHEASKQREAEAQLAKLLEIEGKFDPVHNPYMVLAEIAGEMIRVKDLLREQVERLPKLEDVGSERVATQLQVTMSAYERFLTHTARLATDMSRLDLDAKVAKLTAAIDSETAAIVERALAGALNGAPLDGGQREEVLRLFGALLREPAPALAP